MIPDIGLLFLSHPVDVDVDAEKTFTGICLTTLSNTEIIIHIT